MNEQLEAYRGKALECGRKALLVTKGHMLDFLCAFVVLYVIVSLIWPSSSKADSNRKHQELLAKIDDLQRQTNPPPRPAQADIR